MKLIIQIPCYNEADALLIAMQELPRHVNGFDSVEWLVINDGPTENTAEVAWAHGVDHIIDFTRKRGLATAFLAGLDACIRLGADVIVNTDADNQYNSADIAALVAPILSGRAEIVVGTSPIDQIESFSPLTKVLQNLGNAVVRYVSRADIPDAPNGFRAMSRDAAMRINVFNNYTYTLETIIQAGQKNLAVTAVPVRVNGCLRPSRLVKSIPSYVMNSMVTIVRIFLVYKAFRFFITVGMTTFTLGLLGWIRYLCYYATGNGAGHLQSLTLSSILLGIGFQTMLTAFLADLLAVNRRLMEDVQYRVKKIEFSRRESDP